MEKPPLLFRHPSLFRWALTWFPPYWGTGIRLTEVAADFSRVVVTMRSTVLNRNAFGTHFGGSLYSMCDPFYCLMLVARLGGHVVARVHKTLYVRQKKTPTPPSPLPH